MSICCIIGAGECGRIDFVPKEGDFIIAADGGLETAKRFGIRPDMVVGDFDSLGYKPQNYKTVSLPSEKDVTDTYAAIDEGVSRGYNRFILYGGSGGRTDHTLANIQTAAALSAKGISLLICDGERIIRAVTDSELIFDKCVKGIVSVFAHSNICEGVTLKGLKYPLTDYTLTNIFPLGVSNELIGITASVSVRKGTLVVVHPRYDRWYRQ